MDIDGSKRIFRRLGPSQGDNGSSKQQQKVCFHWRAGRCDRFPCPFLHRELAAPPPQAQGSLTNGTASSKRSHGYSDDYRGGPRRNTNFNNNWGRTPAHGGGNNARAVTKTEKICAYWLQGSCKFGDSCRFLHSWTTGNCFSLLTTLEGHQKVVSGIALPSGSDKLYSGSSDKTVRVWDCQSGQCAGAVNLNGEVGCMLSEGPWIFVGLTNLVKAWNAQTAADLNLTGPVGQVYSLVVGNDMLFAGTKDGILAWKFNVATNCFEPAASLKGHSHHVVSLVVGANRLYSGSMDNTIRVWSLETLQCLQILTDHTSVVMSFLCWDQFLLSCSLDKTVKVWVANESGNLEVTYTHQEEHGVLALCGMHDAEAKPVLLCSCNDNTVRVYDLPSFSERGKIFSKEAIRCIEIGPGGLFFTGDESGQVRVWKWLAETTTAAA
ncbi:PREDICTED: zinc finger CCCH domain-containing protein 48-like [Ipomoea nil]|uniref:Zinc finger CCCH domain-containing protein n=1 Tax=Ipomoea nil TaxID=35883 RepID=X5I199_IPONI|nr:PREDICTED: zinc finger CCCH domain-containing protein 48-like [Ipomoea nil]BAO57291.1 zinc finger CCCH domain-containing protein [Ipomoea nil]